MGEELTKIAVIGTGNVAYHLVKVFLENHLTVSQVVGRTEESARRFAEAYPGVTVIAAPSLLAEADLYILAVSDDKIREAALSLAINDQLIVHTSGAVPLNVLEDISPRTGVFYPLQTLSFGTDVNFRDIPICIEATEKEDYRKLERLAGRISNRVHAVDSQKRGILHLSAVFASNFSYHMFDRAKALLQEEDIDPGILTPLILETARKAASSEVGAGQTGPAHRDDREVIRLHLKLLKENKQYAELYELISKSIVTSKKKSNHEL